MESTFTATIAAATAQSQHAGGFAEPLLLAVAAAIILGVVLVLIHSERTLRFEKSLQRRSELALMQMFSDLPRTNVQPGTIRNALQSAPWILDHAAGALLHKFLQNRSLHDDRDEREAAVEDAVESQPGLRMVRRITAFTAANILTCAVLLSAAEATRGLLEMAGGGQKQALLRAIATGCACNGVLLALSIWCSAIAQRLESADRASLRYAAQAARELSRRLQRTSHPAAMRSSVGSLSPATSAPQARLDMHESLKEPSNGSPNHKS